MKFPFGFGILSLVILIPLILSSVVFIPQLILNGGAMLPWEKDIGGASDKGYLNLTLGLVTGQFFHGDIAHFALNFFWALLLLLIVHEAEKTEVDFRLNVILWIVFPLLIASLVAATFDYAVVDLTHKTERSPFGLSIILSYMTAFMYELTKRKSLISETWLYVKLVSIGKNELVATKGFLISASAAILTGVMTVNAVATLFLRNISSVAWSFAVVHIVGLMMGVIFGSIVAILVKFESRKRILVKPAPAGHEDDETYKIERLY